MSNQVEAYQSHPFDLTHKLTVEKHGHTALVTINNPAANTWDRDSLIGLKQLMGALLYLLFQYLLRGLQTFNQLPLCDQQCLLVISLFSPNLIEAIREGKGQKDHFERRAKLQSVHSKRVGG